MAPPPTHLSFCICEATRNWLFKHKRPWGGEAHVGMWMMSSPDSKSHMEMTELMFLSLHTTTASLPNISKSLRLTKGRGRRRTCSCFSVFVIHIQCRFKFTQYKWVNFWKTNTMHARVLISKWAGPLRTQKRRQIYYQLLNHINCPYSV